MSLGERLFELLLWFRSLTDEQRAMVTELERRPDHVETIRKAGMRDWELFAMVFFEDHARSQVAIVLPGEVVWHSFPREDLVT